ncbi:MAG: hypothetical protein LBI10_01130 [Deltaproteobacteria bacterium]|jgi:hypothetical protein|nr:hypothetical protein [Deltaproteobacteria bacterium]
MTVNSPPAQFGPAVLGGWYLFVGALIGPAIVYFERDPHGRLWPWILLTIVSLGLILHRFSLTYRYDGEKLSVDSFWGLGRRESMFLADLSRVETRYSLSSNLFSLGHLYLTSDLPDDPGLAIIAQKRPEELAETLMALADIARAKRQFLASNPPPAPERL